MHPYALDLLKNLNYGTDWVRSKSRDEFADADAAHPDFAFTVCDNAAGVFFPAWPGQPRESRTPVIVQRFASREPSRFRAAGRK